MKKYLLLALLLWGCAQPLLLRASETTAEAAAKAQPGKLPQGELSLAKRTSIKSLAKRGVRVALWRDGVPVFGILDHSKEGITWTVEQTASIKLPHHLPTLVASNGLAILQYGDNINRDNPAKTDLFFVDARGQETARIVDRYGSPASVEMADDGHVAVAGPLLENNQRTEIGLYTATGEKRFQVLLADGRRANLAVPTPEGQRVAVFSTDTRNYLANHRLELFDGDGKKLAEQPELGILQKAVVVAGGKLLFVQAKDRYGLIDANNGAVLWSRNEVLRLISPYGAATDPQGKTLFLVAAEWDGVPKARYPWRVEVRDVASGNELARFKLPDTYPGNMGRVFLSVTNEQIELLAGDERIVLAWRRP